MNFYQVFKVKKPVIGMIHLLSLTGYKNHPGMKMVIKHAFKELEVLEKGGVDGVLVENENDQPHEIEVGPEIVVAMTLVVKEIVKRAQVPVGVEVLLNDPKASLAIAQATGAKFIRTDYFVDKMSRKKYGGEMKIDPQGLLRYKKKIKASKVLLLTDIQVKYATLLEKGKTITKSVKQAFNAGSDGVIVTGDFSGDEPRMDDLKEAKMAAGKLPIIIGSGATEKNINKFLIIADGAIVGSSLKLVSGATGYYKVKKLMQKVKK